MKTTFLTPSKLTLIAALALSLSQSACTRRPAENSIKDAKGTDISEKNSGQKYSDAAASPAPSVTTPTDVKAGSTPAPIASVTPVPAASAAEAPKTTH